MQELLSLIPDWLKVTIVLLALGAMLWRWSTFRNRLKKRLDRTATKEDVRLSGPTANDVAKAVIAELPSAMSAEQARELAEFREEITRLREAREWIKIAVVVHGYDDPYTEQRKDRPIYAPVLLNTVTGEMKAPPLSECVVSGNKDYFKQEMRGALKTALGSPRWQYVKDAPVGSILMLGVVYHYRNREPVAA